MKKRYSEEQIIGFLKEVEAGVPTKDLCRRHGFSEASFYAWRSKYGGLEVSEAKRLRALEAEKGLGGLTPSQYAQKLATKSDTVTAGL